MVDILLATYNGEKFIRKQIDSILTQDYQEWILYIRDDGSSDSTPEILNDYSQKHPEKVRLIKDDLGNLGFCKNFKQLLHHSQNKYIMFCDQDDIWKKDKISQELFCMEQSERVNGDLPILVFSDLDGIDEEDGLLYKSFIQKNRYKTTPLLFAKLLFQNIVTGCTIMMNRKLCTYAMQMPDGIKCHDHWSALTCLLNGGKIVYLDKTTVSYRQHMNNCIGDLSMSFHEKIHKLSDLSKYREGKRRSIQHYYYLEQQMALLYKNINKRNTNESLLLEQLINIWQMPAYKRIWTLCRNKCFPQDWYMRLIMLMYYLAWGVKTRNHLRNI